MSVQLVTANIGFGSVTGDRPSVQKLIFVARHNYFPERTRIYTSLTGMVEDGIPTDSAVYQAGVGAFSQEPSLEELKIGRFESKSILKPTEVVSGNSYSFQLATSGDEAVLTVDATGATNQEIVDALATGITSSTVNAVVVGAGDDAVLEISLVNSGEWFTITQKTNLTESFDAIPDNTAADELNAIALEDDDWYVLTTDVKEQSYVEAIAADMSARFGFYAVSLDEQDALSGVATGTFKTLTQDAQYLNVYPIYHHLARVTFPEVAEMSEAFAVVDEGITFANRTVIGVGESLTLEGKKLTANMTANLMANGVNFFAKTKISGSTTAQLLNQAITTGKDGGGRVASGEYAFNVVGKDALQIELEGRLTDLLTSQKFGRLVWDEDSFSKVRGTINGVLDYFSDANGWNLIYPREDVDNAYRVILPVLNEVSAAQRKSGVLENTSFIAYLKDAIHLINITGNLDRPN